MPSNNPLRVRDMITCSWGGNELETDGLLSIYAESRPFPANKIAAQSFWLFGDAQREGANLPIECRRDDAITPVCGRLEPNARVQITAAVVILGDDHRTGVLQHEIRIELIADHIDDIGLARREVDCVD